MEDPRDRLVALARPVRHEANNLLAALSGTAELMLRSRDATARDIARAERLRDAAGRLQALLHAYLALGAPPPQGTPPATVLETMRPLARLAFGTGLAVEVEAMAGLPPLPVGQLQAAILRLAQDAGALAAPDSGLRLTLDAARGGALLTATPVPTGPTLPAVFVPAVP
ncbi:hypothetical protein AAFN86_05445 [Roseomonas sp. CAU 1739]|uniref:hypothetical protein n=1 Tax=Roseomonas sp. CAU 1739 TaxID=3140364 RepID=UPI00325BFAE4